MMYEGIAHAYDWTSQNRQKVAEVVVGHWADFERACSELELLKKRFDRESANTGITIETRLREITGMYDEDEAFKEVLDAVRE